jgi:hypothetical protein
MEWSNHLARLLHMLIETFSFSESLLEIDLGQPGVSALVTDTKGDRRTYGLKSCWAIVAR